MTTCNFKNFSDQIPSNQIKFSTCTAINTISAAIAFGPIGALIGFGASVTDEVLIYNDINSYHYFTYAILAISTAELVQIEI